MSKKQKKKVTVKIFPGEAVFVASADILEHISFTYKFMAKDCNDPEEAASWMAVSDQVQLWLNKTYNSGDYDQDEE